MPPKPKFTRQEIIDCALQVVAQSGVEALTANSLRAKLNCSASPIFTVFSSMKEISDEVWAEALRRVEEWQIPGDMPHFKQIGMKLVVFAMNEPNLFKFLFLQENENGVNFENLISKLGSGVQESIIALEEDYGLTEEQSNRVFRTMLVFTFGLGAMCATKVCSFSPNEASEMLTSQFAAVLAFEKTKKYL